MDSITKDALYIFPRAHRVFPLCPEVNGNMDIKYINIARILTSLAPSILYCSDLDDFCAVETLTNLALDRRHSRQNPSNIRSTRGHILIQFFSRFYKHDQKSPKLVPKIVRKCLKISKWP